MNCVNEELIKVCANVYQSSISPLLSLLAPAREGEKGLKRIGNPVFQARTDAAITEINTDIEEIKGQLSGSLANLGSSTKDTSSKLKVGLSFKH